MPASARRHLKLSKPGLGVIALAGLIAFVILAYQHSPLGPFPVQAASIEVTTELDTDAVDGVCSLREAIIAADGDAIRNECIAGSGDDTITFAAGVETITLGSNLPNTTDVAGLTIEGGEVVTIDGDGSRPFPANTGSVTLNDLTVTGAAAGAVNGGAIANFGTLTINNTTLSGNMTDAAGGAIANFGTLTINNGVISDNTAAVSGGGIFNDGGTVTITDSTIGPDNVAGSGGGISNFSSGTTTIIESTISGNSSNSSGGGIANGSGQVTLLRTTVGPGNTAQDGGGIYSSSGLTLTNSTVSGNSATDDGGGIFSPAGTTNLINSTVADNTAADSGGGIYHEAILTVNLTNSIVALNDPTDCGGNGTFNSNGFNLDSDNTCDLTELTDWPGRTANLGPLQDNGGPTETYALLAGSPAINAGNNTACGQAAPTGSAPFDQRGSGFDRISDGICDIGAFEVQVAPPEEEPTTVPEFVPDPLTPVATRTPVPTPTPVATVPVTAQAPITPPATGDGGLR